MVSGNEFSHNVKLDEIGAGETHITLRANEQERAALAQRFDLLTLDMLESQLRFKRDAKGVAVEGRMEAVLSQACIATGDAVAANLSEPVMVRFIAAPDYAADAEIELETNDCDTMIHDGQMVDLGEAVAQTLGLAINPYPRSAAAEETLRKAGVLREDESGPFGALAGLRDKLKL
jgi:uncharacterized metal-binding protein YceD (DUF177 family)